MRRCDRVPVPLAPIIRLDHIADGEDFSCSGAATLEVLPNLANEAFCYRDIRPDEADGSRARVVEGREGERRLGGVVSTGSSAQKQTPRARLVAQLLRGVNRQRQNRVVEAPMKSCQSVCSGGRMPRRDGAVEQGTIHVGVRRPPIFTF